MPTSTVTTYDLTVGVKLNVEDAIWLISPYDVPLLGTNGADGRTTLSADTCFEKKVEWLDENLLTPRTTLLSLMTTGQTTLAVPKQLAFQTNDVVLISTEYIRLTALTTSLATGDTWTASRAYVTTAGAAGTLNTSTAVIGVGSTNPEGNDPQASRSIDRSNNFNLTEIYGPYQVQVSGTENAVQKYGLAGTEFDHQVANRTKEGFVAVEQAILYGQRFDDTTNKTRTMGGMYYYITTNVDSTTTSLTETNLLNALQTCYDAGGTPDRMAVGSKQKRVISGINNTQIRYSQDTNVRGQVVDFYDSDFGRQSVVLDRWVRTQDLFIFARDQATVTTLRPFQFEMLAKTGDSIKGQVVGEKTVKFRRQQWAALFTALT